MTSSIRFIIEFTIAEGKLDELKKLQTTAIETTKGKDSGALSYEFFFNDDESKLYALEWYKDSEAVLSHLEIVGEILNQLLAVSQPTRFEVFGSPSDELVEALAPFSPKVLNHWGGFTR